MKKGYKNILLTWSPGCGKSTKLKELISVVDCKTGFLTEQILNSQWEREWFQLINNIWDTHLLASKIQVSSILFADKYYIQEDAVDRIIKSFECNVWDLIYIDEIAPMQLYSSLFQDFIISILDFKNPIIWVIKLDDDKYPL